MEAASWGVYFLHKNAPFLLVQYILQTKLCGKYSSSKYNMGEIVENSETGEK